MSKYVLPALTSLAVLVLTNLVACSGSEQPLVVYVSADEHVARPILEAFSERTGVPVHLVGDTEATKTTGLVERLRAESDRPVADVFWSSEAFMTIALADEGVLRPHRSEVADGWFESWCDPDRRWFGFSPRPRVLVIDPAVLDEAEVPKSLMDLVDERWMGQIVMADPRFGTTGGHLAALLAWHDAQGAAEDYDQWLADVARNRVRVLPGGNAAVVDEVHSGGALIGLTDADDVRAANRLGAGLRMYPVGPVESTGTFLMPNTVALVAGRHHPRAGEMVDYLLSDEVACVLAESVSGNVPLSPEVASRYPLLAVPEPMEIDLDEAASRYGTAVDRAVVAFKRDGRDGSP